MNPIVLSFDSRFENVTLACVCAKEIMVGRISEQKLADIVQALAETINNCIEHAYSGSQDRPITIRYLLNTNKLLIEVTDQGKLFDLTKLLKAADDFDYELEDINNLPEGGFGLNVIKNCMDDVTYKHENDSNVWCLTKFF